MKTKDKVRVATYVLGAMVMLSRETLLLTVTSDGMESISAGQEKLRKGSLSLVAVAVGIATGEGR